MEKSSGRQYGSGQVGLKRIGQKSTKNVREMRRVRKIRKDKNVIRHGKTRQDKRREEKRR